jgi:hypothetical protein
MTGFSVSVDALVSTAAAVEHIVVGVSGSEPLLAPTNVGHVGLSGAIASFTSDVSRSWEMRHRATENIASGLRKTAGVYDDADSEGASRARSGGGTF